MAPVGIHGALLPVQERISNKTMSKKNTLFGSGYKIAAAAFPLLFAAFFIGRMSQEFCFRFVSKALLLGAGVGFMIIGGVIYLSSAVLIVRAYKSGSLVTGGPFAFSRNPMYASFVMFLVPATSFIIDNWLMCAAVPFMYVIVNHFCGEEEVRLEERFGREWRVYAQCTGKIIPRLR